MGTDLTRTVATVVAFLVIFVTGIWLSRGGRPLNVLVLTLHKLISLGVAVTLVVVIYRSSHETRLTGLELAVVVITGFLFVVTGAVGGLLSSDTTPTTTLQRLHQVTPVLTVISTAASLYLIHG